MIIKNEDELLDIGVRKRIIEEINGTENKARKQEAYKRYQCYKDQTFIYVRNQLLRQFDASTVNEMSYALANISFTRKVVDKLARVYKYGVEREIEGTDDDIEVAVSESDMNAALKKCNRYFKLFKNTLFYIRPKPTQVEGELHIKPEPLAPYLYDVVEMADEREKPMAVILSDYSPELNETLAVRPGTDGRVSNAKQYTRSSGDNIDQSIADSPGDEQSGQYIFWTRSYHFVCNSKGEVIDGPEDGLNPVEELPFVNFSDDQDGSFWAIGGDDLTDGAILVNSMITNINHIAITQGYGQLVVTGKDLPQTIKVGPNKAVRLTHEGEDPVPTFDFKTANPPLDQLRSLVEMYVALMLTTNNLSTSGVQSNLNGAAAFPSGIAMMIDKAESMEDVEDQRQIFIDNEPHIWRIYSKWHNILKSRGELSAPLSEITLPDEPDVQVKFGKPAAIETEMERLQVLKLKKEMGIISMIDMIKAEHPGMTDEEAAVKLKEILEEKMARMEAFTRDSQGQQNNIDENNSDDRPGSQAPIGSEEGSGGLPDRASAEQGSPEEESGNG